MKARDRIRSERNQPLGEGATWLEVPRNNRQEDIRHACEFGRVAADPHHATGQGSTENLPPGSRGTICTFLPCHFPAAKPFRQMGQNSISRIFIVG
jgi:hypothetical protein